MVDSVPVTTPYTFVWAVGSSHTLEAHQLVSTGPDLRYNFTGWSDGGSASHNYVVTSSDVVTAYYTSQYQVSFVANPVDGGTINPAGENVWVNKGSHIISAAADTGLNYEFVSWSSTGPITFINSSSPLTTAIISGSGTIIAGFGKGVHITIDSNIDGFGFIMVDNNPITTPRTFLWEIGSTHTLQANTLISVESGMRYVFDNWSDSGSQNHTYVVSADALITATYNAQYRLTIYSDHGSPSPPIGDSNWYNDGSTVTAFVNSPADELNGIRYNCIGWSGSGSVPMSGLSNSIIFTISQPSALTWNWMTQYQVNFVTVPPMGGTTSPSGQVWMNAWPLPISATPSFGYQFYRWSTIGGVIIADPLSSTTIATLNGPGTITSSFTHQEILLSDGFEGPMNEWTGGWYNSAPGHDSATSRKSDNTHTGELTSKPLDASNAIAMRVDFWYYYDGNGGNEIKLYFFDGASYNLITTLSNSTTKQRVWYHYTASTITNTQYFIPNFKIRFSTSITKNGVFALIDDVRITKDVV